MGFLSKAFKRVKKQIQPSIGSIRTPDNFVLPPLMDEDRIINDLIRYHEYAIEEWLAEDGKKYPKAMDKFKLIFFYKLDCVLNEK